MKQKHSEVDVVRALQTKNDINVAPYKTEIEVLTGERSKGDIGNKSKGKIDFLTKYCGYRLFFVRKFSNQ